MRGAMPFLAALALASGAAHAQIYKCVAATGKTVYSQSPCPQGAKSTTLGRSAPASSGAAAAPAEQKSAAQLEQEFRKRRLEQEKAEKKSGEQAAQAKEKQENCRSARAQLASLDSGMRQMRVNEKGERYYLEGAQIEQEKSRARQAIETSCS